MRPAARNVIEIFLQPGDFYFGDRDTRIRTLLGSCVSITMWHPRLHVGGMCHFMLPERGPRARSDGLDGRYAEDAIALFQRELRALRVRAEEFQVKLFGGGRMFRPHARSVAHAAMLDVGQRNVDAARGLLHHHGFRVKAAHVAGEGHRNLIFDVGSGEVWMRHVGPAAPPGAQADEEGARA
jgi:chemotaxis protein CheD